MATQDDVILFFRPNERWGFLSQWDGSPFAATVNEVLKPMRDDLCFESTEDFLNSILPEEGRFFFKRAEQFMMFSKAVLFGDMTIASSVLGSDLPGEQKRLGRGVKGFDENKWARVRYEVVVQGTRLKFRQDAGLRASLLSTRPMSLAEAAPNDRVWGIGYDAKSAWSHVEGWGSNLLGQALMKVREELAEEETTGWVEAV